MSNFLKNIFHQINYRQILAFFFIIVGICIAIFGSNIAVKITGIGITVFAIVSLISFISQKLSYSVKPNQFQIKTPSHLKATVIADDKAKRTTIDNFNDEKYNQTRTMVDFMGADEGFIIVNKSAEPKNEEEHKPKSQKIYAVDFESKEEIANEAIEEQIQHNIQENNTDRLIVDSDEKIEKSEETTESQINISDNRVEIISTEIEEDYENKFINQEHYVENSEQMEQDRQNADNYQINNEHSIDNTAEKEVKNVFSGQEKNYREKHVDIPISLITNENELKNPVEEFGYLISRFLVIIRSVIDANTVAFVWINHEKQTLLFDSYINDKKVNEAIKKDTKIPVGSDVLSQILTNAKPEILTEINPNAELDLIPYYSHPVGTSSFIGIPIVFENSIVGILCADTDTKEAYDESTVVFLGQFTKLLSTLFSSYSQKFTSINAAKTIDLMNQLTDLVSEKGCTFSNICSSVIELLAATYDCSSIGICAYNDAYDAWLVSNYKSIENIDDTFLATPVMLETSLIGMSILNCKTISISQMSDEYTRVNQYEPNIENGSFVVVPVKSTTDTFGALFMEAKASSALNNIEIDLVEAICNQAGEMYEKINLISFFSNTSVIDRQTGILNNKALKLRIEEELLRASDTHQTLSLSLISLDKYSALDDRDKKNKVMNYLIGECRKYLKKYDIMGRVNDDVIGIVNINQDAGQAKLYLERIRHLIATQFVEINSEKMVLTISAGIATASSNDTFDTFATNATAALQIAQARANFIQIYQ